MAGASKSAGGSKEMKGGGQSKGTTTGKANQIRIFNLFLQTIQTTDPELASAWGATWEELPEAVLADTAVWGHFATYLCETYRIEKGYKRGERLMLKTAHGIWGGVIEQARQRLSKSKIEETMVSACTFLCLRASACALLSRPCLRSAGLFPQLP